MKSKLPAFVRAVEAKSDELEPEALADFLRANRLAPQAQRVLAVLPLDFTQFKGNIVSVEKFELALANGKFSKAERTWFPNWWLRFREFLIHHQLLPADVEQSVVIQFLQQIKSVGTPA